MLNEQKKQALETLKAAKSEYLVNMTRENWIKYCEAVKVCRLLGVRI